jgi:hypothetical protein
LHVWIIGVGFFVLNDEDVIVTACVGFSFVVGVEGAVGIGSCFIVMVSSEQYVWIEYCMRFMHEAF